MAIFACRLFYSQRAFDEELARYREPALAQLLPGLLHWHADDAGAVRSRSGCAFPPFLVLERGTTLHTWLSEQTRDWPEVLRMMEALARLLDSLHRAGYVHGDLKARSR